MSEWTPKVGDKVMVGEWGPFEVTGVAGGDAAFLASDGSFQASVPIAWLTPAPEPEPDEPTAFGALVRDGRGVLWAKSKDWWECLVQPESATPWPRLRRPVTVVLADPAEVEQLRGEVERLHAEVGALRDANDVVKADALHAEARADKLQRRIDKTAEFVETGVYGQRSILRLLRGES